MYLMFDTKNGTERVASLPICCEFCNMQYECSDFNCIHYRNFNEGEREIYKGNIGSALMAMCAYDIDSLEERVYSACIKRENYADYMEFATWIAQFRTNKTDIIEKFFLYDILFECYHTLPVSGLRYEMLAAEIKQRLLVFKSIKKYIEGCVSDNTLYDPSVFDLANNLFFHINSSPLDYNDLFFDIPEKGVRDYEPCDFLSKLKAEYSLRKDKSSPLRDPLFEKYDKVYVVDNINDFAIASLKQILENCYKFKNCENCGIPFIPYNRIDAKYCDRNSPQDSNKTCKEYGARQAWQRTLKESESAGLYRNIYMSKQMLAKRNPDIPAYKASFEQYKTQAKQWKADVKTGAKTEAEYIAWLKEVKERKVL